VAVLVVRRLVLLRAVVRLLLVLPRAVVRPRPVLVRRPVLLLVLIAELPELLEPVRHPVVLLLGLMRA
jgi:hypothetical protein